MALKRQLSFDELVQENRQQMLQDESVLEKIEQNMKANVNPPIDERAPD
ncbi:hypothetical protein GCM10028778_11520 [Barrientosiimonas marina]|uniref:FbpB family small basic protein n=1 Tax=Lentibacillus kimchii TaxID=1542911 RepID=A0ABW2V1Y1_9BACI